MLGKQLFSLFITAALLCAFSGCSNSADTVRASGGNNAKRHLLIAGYATDIDLTCDELFRMPEDPENRMAVSVHSASSSGTADGQGFSQRIPRPHTPEYRCPLHQGYSAECAPGRVLPGFRYSRPCR